jgi:hypothetical protein
VPSTRAAASGTLAPEADLLFTPLHRGQSRRKFKQRGHSKTAPLAT